MKPSGEPRRPELDALRAFAMLLGVALHAALTFFPGVWPVQDRTAGYHGPWEELFFAVHGFRMPAFFLLSGFFTAMLWRRRGLWSLIRHRLRRVAVPLALAMVTVGPAMDWVVARALGSKTEGFSVRDLLPRLGEFHHLWFLWMLLWLLAGFLVVAFVADRVRATAPRGDDPAQPAWPRRVMWLLVPLTLLPQLGMAGGGAYPMFGPDTNTGLLPSLHVLSYRVLRLRGAGVRSPRSQRSAPGRYARQALAGRAAGHRAGGVSRRTRRHLPAGDPVLAGLPGPAGAQCLGHVPGANRAVPAAPDPRVAERALLGGCLILDLPRSPAAGDRRADRRP